MQSAASKKLPENVGIMVLDTSTNLPEDIGLAELSGYLSEEHYYSSGVIISSTEGGRHRPY